MKKIVFGKVAGSAAIIEERKILLLKRSSSASLYPDHWTFPSGGIEETDASARETVIREVREETGIDFAPTEKLGFYESVVDGKRYFALVHLGVWSGNIQLQPEEIQEYRFCTSNEALSLPLAFAYKDVIQDLFTKGFID